MYLDLPACLEHPYAVPAALSAPALCPLPLAGQPVKIVTVGGSVTVGVGSMDPQKYGYPGGRASLSGNCTAAKRACGPGRPLAIIEQACLGTRSQPAAGTTQHLNYCGIWQGFNGEWSLKLEVSPRCVSLVDFSRVCTASPCRPVCVLGECHLSAPPARAGQPRGGGHHLGTLRTLHPEAGAPGQ